MLETTRIRREGYSYRPDFETFMERFAIFPRFKNRWLTRFFCCSFGLLAFGAKKSFVPNTATCQKVMQISGLQGWLMGKTKV
jgi:hypothetical protein